MKKLSLTILLILSFTFTSFTQIKVIDIERINLSKTTPAFQAKFSPDGSSLFFTNINYDGIWKLSLKDKTPILITNDKFSGFDYAIGDSTVIYRRSLYNGVNRHQEIIEVNLNNNKSSIIETAEELSTPFLLSGKILYTKNRGKLNIEPPKTKDIKLLGIENTKIIILKDGKKEIFDPITNGNYIWPSVSPDGKLLLAYEMSKGTFICTLEGEIISFLGRKNSPCFTKDGKWIVYMNDKDDGYNIISSDIYCTSIDGKQNIQLTNDKNVIELNPICSPTENKIVFSSLEGDLYILTYEEMK